MSTVAPVSYALTPGHLNLDDPIDLNDKLGRDGLSARGDETSNLIMEIFKGYKVAADHEFVKCIKTREDRYLKGETLTDDLLMQLERKWGMESSNRTRRANDGFICGIIQEDGST